MVRCLISYCYAAALLFVPVNAVIVRVKKYLWLRDAGPAKNSTPTYSKLSAPQAKPTSSSTSSSSASSSVAGSTVTALGEPPNMLPQWLSHILSKSGNLNRVAAGRVAATSTEGRKIFSQEALRGFAATLEFIKSKASGVERKRQRFHSRGVPERKPFFFFDREQDFSTPAPPGKTPHLDSTLSSRVKVEDDADLAAVRDFLRIFEAESWELPWSHPNNVSVPVWLTEVVDASQRVFSWVNDVDVERGATSGWRAPKAALRALCKAEAEEGRTMAGEDDDAADSTTAEVGTGIGISEVVATGLKRKRETAEPEARERCRSARELVEDRRAWSLVDASSQHWEWDRWEDNRDDGSSDSDTVLSTDVADVDVIMSDAPSPYVPPDGVDLPVEEEEDHSFAGRITLYFAPKKVSSSTPAPGRGRGIGSARAGSDGRVPGSFSISPLTTGGPHAERSASPASTQIYPESGTLRLGEGSWRNSVYFTIELFYVRVRQKGRLFGKLKLRGIRAALEDGRRVRGRPVGTLWRTPVLVEEESYSLAGWRDEIYGIRGEMPSTP